jgi:hypothetical protein
MLQRISGAGPFSGVLKRGVVEQCGRVDREKDESNAIEMAA